MPKVYYFYAILQDYYNNSPTTPTLLNLIIDIGNTKIKLAIFENNRLVKIIHTTKTEIKLVADFTDRYPEIQNSIVSSVRNYPKELISFLESRCKQVLFFTTNTKIPLENLYQSKKTLGYDRLAACIGAKANYANKNILVIDAGTAITFDFVNDKGQYLGGCISPGLHIRFKALHDYTEKLPNLSPNNNFHLIGTNTNDAIVSGVQNGIVFETDLYISKLLAEYPNLKVILTGGDAQFISNNIDGDAEVNPNLVLEGLNHILEYNLLIFS